MSLSTDRDPSPSQAELLPNREKLTILEKSAYAGGCIPLAVISNAIAYLATPIYSVILGVSPIFVGNMQLISQAVSMIFEPFWANVSDNTRSRFGRRHPFIFIGGLGCIASFVMFCLYPAGLTPKHYCLYLGACVLGFSLSQSVYGIGYLSLLPEITTDSKERTHILGISAQVFMVGALGTVWSVPFIQSAFFSDIRHGLRYFMGYLGGLALLTIIGQMLFVKERYGSLVAKTERINIRTAFLVTLRIKPIYPLLAMKIMTAIASNLVATLGTFVGLYFVFDGNVKLNWFWGGVIGTVWLIEGIVVINPAIRLCDRIGRKKVLFICCGMMIGASLLKPFCYVHGVTWQILGPYVLMGPSSAVIYTIFNALSADLTDYAELQTGRRQEGMINIVLGWVDKVTYAICMSISGYLLMGTGFKLELGAHQLAGVYGKLMFWFVAIPVVSTIGIMIGVAFYPLTEKRMREVRIELERRHSMAAA